MKTLAHISRCPFGLSLLVGVLVLIGCGGISQAPLAPGVNAQKVADNADNTDSNPAYFVLSTRDMSPSEVLRAAKPSGKATSKTEKKNIDDRRGGRIWLNFSAPNRARRDAVYLDAAYFDVEPRSLAKDTDITMTVSSGITLEDIVVTFGPSGTKFNPPATLTLWVSGDINVNLLKAYHIEETGGARAVTNAQFKAVQTRDGWILTIKVFGFSQYSVGDDWVPETVGAPGSGG